MLLHYAKINFTLANTALVALAHRHCLHKYDSVLANRFNDVNFTFVTFISCNHKTACLSKPLCCFNFDIIFIPMKTPFILFCLFITSFNLQADNTNSENVLKLLSGKIVDKKNGEEIAGAVICIGDKKVYSDLNGTFSVFVDVSNTTVIISSISYLEINVVLDPMAYGTMIIELQEK
jgi:hypothetical protein